MVSQSVWQSIKLSLLAPYMYGGAQYFPVSVKGQRSGDATQLKIQFVLPRGFGISSNYDMNLT